MHRVFRGLKPWARWVDTQAEMVRPTVTSLIACVTALACAVPAAAQEPPEMRGHAQKASKAGQLLGKGRAHAAASRLWATVNVCDTERSPDSMGIRASMPGNGKRQQMYMRFSAQWYSGQEERWLDVPGGVSPWQRAGSARYVARQAGYTFEFVSPPAGRGYLMRGSVEFQWRALTRPRAAKRDSWSASTKVPPERSARWMVARRDSLLTRTGIKGVDGGDPKGTSKAICLISNPAG
jgi:hypothetical protein